MKKTTIYIDIEDDIASIIDKVTASDQKIVALVLPKRPSTLQGSVNLQLLKQSAEDVAKSIVLITSDEQVLRLAGAAGLHVSPSLQSKPYIPKNETVDEDSVEEISDDVMATGVVAVATAKAGDPAQPDIYADDKKLDPQTPIGELAGDEMDEIELDNSEPSDTPVSDKEATKEKSSKKSAIKVPNFNQFRTRLIVGGVALVALIAFFVWATVFAPSATITITTEKSDVQAKLSLTASTTTTTVDAEKALVPAVRKEDKQKLTGTFTATGQKDVGTRASGIVSLRNCESTDELTIPSGTGVSRGAYTFITQEAVTLEGGSFSGGGTVCTTPNSEIQDVDVVASQPGDQYNLASGTYTVAGFPSVRATGGAMGGGTTKIVKVVTGEDVEAAKAKVLEQSASNVKGKLSQTLKDEQLIPIEDTFVSSVGEPQSSIAVGAEATTDPTLTIEVTSTMLGMKRSDIDPLIAKEVEKQIDPTTQKIYSSGLEDAVIAVVERPNADTASLTVSTSTQVGPNLDSQAVAQEVAGRRAGEAKQQLEARPGVSNVEIDLSPFWVFSLPKNASKTTVSINE